MNIFYKISFLFALSIFFKISLYAAIQPIELEKDFFSYAAGEINSRQHDTIKENHEELNIPGNHDIYYPESQFRIAGAPRFTMDGGTARINTQVNIIPASITGTAFLAIFIIQHEAQQNTIWKKIAPFNVAEDGKYTAYLDKCGHFYGTYMPAYLLSESLMEMGFSWDAATNLGGILGLAYTTYVEVLDGYSSDFGFSPSDFYADLAGASFFVAQRYVPLLQNFTPKFMYVKPSWIGEKDRLPHDAFIDNYSAQVFWLTINMHNLLPEKAKDYWPKWLELSVGYAVYSITGEITDGFNRELIYKDPHFGTVYGNQKLLISLDYNLIHLLPEGPGVWNWLRQGLNYFKLPSPVLEIGKKTRFYLLYPIPIKL